MKKTGERMMKMMAGLTNQLSKAWHFPLCRILVSFLTSRALSWPDGFPVCHFASLSTHSSDLLRQTPIPLPCHYRSVQMIVITGPSQHHEATAIELGESVLSSLPWSLIVTFKGKEEWQTSTQTTVEYTMIGVWQNCSHSEKKLLKPC